MYSLNVKYVIIVTLACIMSSFCIRIDLYFKFVLFCLRVLRVADAMMCVKIKNPRWLVKNPDGLSNLARNLARNHKCIHKFWIAVTAVAKLMRGRHP